MKLIVMTLALVLLGCARYEEAPTKEKGVPLQKSTFAAKEAVEIERAHIANQCKFDFAEQKPSYPDSWGVYTPFQKLGNETFAIQESLDPLRNDSELVFSILGRAYYLTPGIPGWIKERGPNRIAVACFDGTNTFAVEYEIREGEGRFLSISPSAEVVTTPRAIAVAAPAKGGSMVVTMKYYYNGEMQRPSVKFKHVSGGK